MIGAHNSRAIVFARTLPLLLSCLSVLLSGVYEAQRSGLLSQQLSRYVQHHLDGFAGGATLAALLGILAGFAMHRFKGRSWIVVWGILASIMAFLWCTLGLSL